MDGSSLEKVAGQFAKGVIRKKWAELVPLFAASAQATYTEDRLAAEFGWKTLRERLRQMHIALSGDPEDMVPQLDPPKRFEMYEVEERDPPPGHDAAVPVQWMEIDFQPSEDSEFDECYKCFLVFVEEDGPRIAAYAIESSTE